jgi:hypothetical protein
MKPWMGAFIRTLASRFGGVEEERRARAHSGPSMSAVGPIPSGPVASGPASSVLAGAPARAPVNSGMVTSAVPIDRSDITIVADVMGESLTIDMSDVDDSLLASTLPTAVDRSVALEQDEGATALIEPRERKPPAPGS